ncbi:MAG: low affinity iron permease family protein [Vampirovibrio sp.]|nr:low affinity iron permease family protein [Vampirovibrio sp.]
MREFFRLFSHKVSEAMGSPFAFLTAVLVIVAWASVGKLFNFSDTWQLVINTSTTIITFLMVFLIQNTQNRDARVTGLKLDEIIRAHKGARDSIIELQALSDAELDALEAEFLKIREEDVILHHSLRTVEKVISAHHQARHQAQKKHQ